MTKRFNLSCFFGFHTWECVDITPYTDTSYGCRCLSIDYTRICIHCGKIQNSHIYGCTITDPKLLSSKK